MSLTTRDVPRTVTQSFILYYVFWNFNSEFQTVLPNPAKIFILLTKVKIISDDPNSSFTNFTENRH